MGWLILIIILVAIAAAYTVVKRAKNKAAERQRHDDALRARADRSMTDPFADEVVDTNDPRTIRAGCIVEIPGVGSFVVRGTGNYDDGEDEWKEHLVETTDATNTQRWLVVSEDQGHVKVSLWEDLPDTGIDHGVRSLEYDGIQYRLVETGHAQYTSDGTTGLKPVGLVDYRDYKGDGYFSLFSFEKFGLNWSASRGFPVDSYIIYPPATVSDLP